MMRGKMSMRRRKGLEPVIATLLMITVIVAAAATFYFFSTLLMGAWTTRAGIELKVTGVDFYLGPEPNVDISGPVTTQKAVRGCTNLTNLAGEYNCHLVWTTGNGFLYVATGEIHPVGDGVYKGYEDCLACHVGPSHNLNATTDGGCFKSGCHAGGANKAHTSEACLQPGCHLAVRDTRTVHNVSLVVVYISNVGTEDATIDRILVDGKEAPFQINALPGYESTLTLEPKEKICLSIYGFEVKPNTKYTIEVIVAGGGVGGSLEVTSPSA
jgi:flagellin-like protein